MMREASQILVREIRQEIEHVAEAAVRGRQALDLIEQFPDGRPHFVGSAGLAVQGFYTGLLHRR